MSRSVRATMSEEEGLRGGARRLLRAACRPLGISR